MKKLISTVGSPTEYALYKLDSGGFPVYQSSVRVEHFANIYNPKTRMTEAYTEVELSDEDAKLIEENGVYKIQKESGYVKIVNVNDNTAIADLNARDNSAQLDEDTLKNRNPALKEAKITVKKASDK